MKHPLLLAAFLCVAQAQPLVFSAEALWTRFRGEDGRGIVEDYHGPIPGESNRPVDFELPGGGAGSVAISSNRYFLQVADTDTHTRGLVCLDRQNGRILWQANQPFESYPIHKFSSYASSTPCLDDSHVYNVWGSPQQLTVECYTHEGEKTWSRDLGSFVSQHGFGSSMIRHKDLVILFASEDAEELPPGVPPGRERLIALDAASGQTRWETDLNPTRTCYGVPVVVKHQGQDAVLIANTADGFMLIDAASGQLKENTPGFTKRIVSSPLANQQYFIASEGSGGGGNRVAIFDRQAKEIAAWVDKAAAYVPTGVLTEDRLFIWSDSGIVSAVELASGKSLWTRRIGGSFSASPLLLGSVLVNVDHDGKLTAFDVGGDEPKEVGKYDFEEMCRSTPSATENELVVRTDRHLHVFRNTQSSKSGSR